MRRTRARSREGRSALSGERPGASSLLEEIEPKAARALASAGFLAAGEPQERRAVDPAGVLEPAHDPHAAARHLLLEQAEVLALGLEDPTERLRELRLAALVD